jgi:hypothetical protein
MLASKVGMIGGVTMLTDTQKKNYEFFKSNLSNYLSDPLKIDKYAVIYDEKLQGLYDSFEAAYLFACSTGTNDFVIQQIIDQNATVSFLSSAV